MLELAPGRSRPEAEATEIVPPDRRPPEQTTTQVVPVLRGPRAEPYLRGLAGRGAPIAICFSGFPQHVRSVNEAALLRLEEASMNAWPGEDRAG